MSDERSNLPEHRLWQPTTAKWFAVVFGASLAYAVVRYHIVGTVPWKDFPFFILNKSISLSAFILLTCNFGLGPLNNLGVKVPAGWLNARQALGMTGFLLVLIHALMSFMLFSHSFNSSHPENSCFGQCCWVQRTWCSWVTRVG